MSDTPLRIAIILWICFLLPCAAYFRIRSNASHEKLDRWQEGVWILFGLRLSAAPLFVAGVLWLCYPRAMSWSTMPLPVWLRWVGFAIFVAAGVLQLWAFATLGKNLTDTVVTRRDHTLVTAGPYRFVRHPFYLAFLLGIIGLTLLSANWFILPVGLVPFLFILTRLPIEERKLEERFGDAYRDYRARTGAFVPRVFSRQT
jgi:protein-S-isoprenylcysteine O-methyltransferase Ste14